MKNKVHWCNQFNNPVWFSSQLEGLGTAAELFWDWNDVKSARRAPKSSVD